MRIARDVSVAGLRMSLELNSLDGPTHSGMEARKAEIIEALQAVHDRLAGGQRWVEKTQRIRLGVEAPAYLLPYTTAHTDLDFAIAYRVLKDDDYASWYANRDSGRELILDNNLHELGEASLDDLLNAARIVFPDYVIAPDRLRDSAWTTEQYLALRAIQKRDALPFKVGVVLSGTSYEDREEMIKNVLDADMLCLPYDQPRLSWWHEQFPPFSRVHLLGVSERAELESWLPFSSSLDLSVDTGKATKYGLLGQHLSKRRSWRRSGLTSHDLLEGKDCDGLACANVLSNLDFLHKLLK